MSMHICMQALKISWIRRLLSKPSTRTSIVNEKKIEGQIRLWQMESEAIRKNIQYWQPILERGFAGITELKGFFMNIDDITRSSIFFLDLTKYKDLYKDSQGFNYRFSRRWLFISKFLI